MLIWCNLHECVGWVKLLAEFDNTLQIVVKQILRIKIELIFTQWILISLDHHENNLLVLVWAFEEILEVTLLLNFILGLFNMIHLILLHVFDFFCKLEFMLFKIGLFSFTFEKYLVIIPFFIVIFFVELDFGWLLLLYNKLTILTTLRIFWSNSGALPSRFFLKLLLLRFGIPNCLFFIRFHGYRLTSCSCNSLLRLLCRKRFCLLWLLTFFYRLLRQIWLWNHRIWLRWWFRDLGCLINLSWHIVRWDWWNCLD